MKKKLVSVLIALVMAFAISIPVMAYDAEQPEWPDTQFELVKAYHWVVRGDTIGGIAALWGTSVDRIILYNFDYFADLTAQNRTFLNDPTLLTPADLLARGVTQLEPGVRLHVGWYLQVTHWVIRGDTFVTLGNGAAFRGPEAAAIMPNVSGFSMTQAEIEFQNPAWFAQLGLLGATRSVPFLLEESFHMLNVPLIQHFATNPAATPASGTPATTVNTMTGLGNPSRYGSPLVLTVRVGIDWSTPFFSIGRSTVTFLRSAAETVPQVPFDPADPFVSPQQTSNHPWPTNPLLLGHPLGILYAPMVGALTGDLYVLPGGPAWMGR